VTSGQLDPVAPSALAGRDQAVSAATAERIYASVPENTRRSYARIWDGTRTRTPPEPDLPPDPETPLQERGFVGWCEYHGRTAMPATPQTLAEYVNYLCDRDRAPATIEQVIAAIRTRHRLAGHGKHFPDAEAAMRVLKTHRRDRAARGLSGQKQALPVEVDALRQMVESIDTDTLIGARDHAVLLFGVCVFGRRSELVELRWSDLAGAQEGMTVRIRMSKTDQEAKGETIPVLWGTFPGTNPILVTDRWREALSSRTAIDGYLLRSVDRHGRVGDALSAKAVNEIVRRRAQMCGLTGCIRKCWTATGRCAQDIHPNGYSAHSLRAGAATIAYKNGAPISTICRLGRWKPGSRVVLGYIRAADQWKDHPFRGAL
jgi:integrase